MANLKVRLQRLELDHPSFKLDFSLMTDEELEKLVVDLTRDTLRVKLNREPTDAEVAQERDKERAFFASLSLEEINELRAKLERQA